MQTATHDPRSGNEPVALTMVSLVVLGLVWAGWALGAGLAVTHEPVPVAPGARPRQAGPQVPRSRPRSRARRRTGARPRRPAPCRIPPPTLTGKDGAPMVLVPAGEFMMGSEQGDDDEQPVHRVFLDSFYLDTFEVTNGRFAKFVAAIQSEPPWGFADQETPVVHADRPVRWVNWLEATGYCLWAGKRLPTEAEWEKAARGTDGRRLSLGRRAPDAGACGLWVERRGLRRSRRLAIGTRGRAPMASMTWPAISMNG